MDQEKIRRVRESIALGHYSQETLEGKLHLQLATDRVLEFLTGSTSRPSRQENGGAADADGTDSP
ncbi:hypothetical protein LCGC14_2161430 [marine sediment metagenome]|uniref:Uncharacterized protein n=1 Tax=marine sediment metagenome TaxID=412755 RepID=A0A0F9EEZ3_9ZZZZ